LAIVEAIAEAHGGAATVTSRPGEGSRFEITLPLG
jgi:signal transduction histidine kinase